MGNELKPEEKAAEKWRERNFTPDNETVKAITRTGKFGFVACLVHKAFLAGVKWERKEAKK